MPKSHYNVERARQIRKEFGIPNSDRLDKHLSIEELAELGALVSHTTEQRVLAVLKHSPEIVGTARFGAIAKLSKFCSTPISHGTAYKCLLQLQHKGIVHLERGSGEKRPKILGIYLKLNPDELRIEEWALAEWRKAMDERMTGATREPDKVPDSWDVPEHRRRPKAKEADHRTPTEVVVVNKAKRQEDPPPPPPIQTESTYGLDPMDYGALADELFARLMAKLSEPSTFNVTAEAIEPEVNKDDYERLRQYAYDIEQERNALRAQVTQQEDNIKTLIEAAQDLQQRVDVAEARLRKVDEDKRITSRSQRLGDVLSPESKAALEGLARNG